MLPAELRARSVHLERAGVLLLLLAALLPRARDLFAPFDREAEGWQGAFFATCAINYERLGFGAFGGYPVYNVDLPPEGREELWLLYANHPPTVAWLAWLGAKGLGPAGWADAWREGVAPEGLEAPLRWPFLAFHLFGLWAFWWAVRQGVGAQQALLALALLAVMPVSALYGVLVNYETPSVPLVLLAYGFHVRWLRGRGARELALTGLSFAAACSFTYGPAFFAPPLVLLALAHRGVGAALRTALATGGGVAAPLLVHALAARRVFVRLGLEADSLTSRVADMLAPLLDGSAPVTTWAAVQWRHMHDYLGVTILAAACAGLAVALVRAVRARLRARAGAKDSVGGAEPHEIDLALPLALGAGLMLFGYYKHNLTEQTTFLLNLAPGAAALGAVALQALSRPLLRLRGGIASLVVVTSLIAMPALARYSELHRLWRAPGPNDHPPGELGPDLPLPDEYGRALGELVPPGATVFYPGGLGLSLSYFYYAWRTLVPIEQPAPFQLPTYLALPVRPPAGAAAAVARARATFASGLPEIAASAPTAANSHWEVWLLEP